MSTTARVCSAAAAAIVAIAVASTASAAAPLRVELNGDNGRNDVRTPHWTDWRIPNGPATSGTFGDVRLTLRAVGADGTPHLQFVALRLVGAAGGRL